MKTTPTESQLQGLRTCLVIVDALIDATERAGSPKESEYDRNRFRMEAAAMERLAKRYTQRFSSTPLTELIDWTVNDDECLHLLALDETNADRRRRTEHG